MNAKERKQKARDALDHRIAQALFAARFGSPEKPPATTVDEAIDAHAAACVAEARASIVAWIRATDARLDAQAKAGAKELHYMHTVGIRDAAQQLADAIEAETDTETVQK